MKTSPEELSQLTEQLRDFLIEAKWTSARQVRNLTFFSPPESLGIQGKYTIALPNFIEKTSSANLIHSAANSLVEIYGFSSIGDLLNKAASLSDLSSPTRIITRFIDGKTRNGTIPLSSLAAYASNIEAGLYRSAKFKLGSESKESRFIAQRFAKDCLFLQTEHGSFVAKIEVPHIILKQPDLFGGESIASAEVCSALFSAIQFINDKIIGDNDEFESPEILSNAIALFDVELLESLMKTMTTPEMEAIDFSLEVGTNIRTSSTGWLSDDRKHRLKDFYDFIRDQLHGENDLDVSGTIVELRSRDPEGNRNYIRVVSPFHGDRTFISATLSNDQYQRAVDAHRNKRQVRIKGNGIRLKTQIRLTEVTEFIT